MRSIPSRASSMETTAAFPSPGGHIPDPATDHTWWSKLNTSYHQPVRHVKLSDGGAGSTPIDQHVPGYTCPVAISSGNDPAPQEQVAGVVPFHDGNLTDRFCCTRYTPHLSRGSFTSTIAFTLVMHHKKRGSGIGKQWLRRPICQRKKRVRNSRLEWRLLSAGI